MGAIHGAQRSRPRPPDTLCQFFHLGRVEPRHAWLRECSGRWDCVMGEVGRWSHAIGVALPPQLSLNPDAPYLDAPEQIAAHRNATKPASACPLRTDQLWTAGVGGVAGPLGAMDGAHEPPGMDLRRVPAKATRHPPTGRTKAPAPAVDLASGFRLQASKLLKNKTPTYKNGHPCGHPFW